MKLSLHSRETRRAQRRLQCAAPCDHAPASFHPPSSILHPPSSRAFTMVEIALCLGVIGFALVAIVGILPMGLQVQKDNRQDTIASQDGTYFLEAIRSGSQGLDQLTNHVVKISQITRYRQVEKTNPVTFATGAEIIGLLSICSSNLYRTEAYVRALSGSAVENGINSGTDIGFAYLLVAQITPFTNFYTNDLVFPLAQTLQTNAHELRLMIRYPLNTNNGACGSGKQVFRTLVSGKLDTNHDGTFFQPTAFYPLP